MDHSPQFVNIVNDAKSRINEVSISFIREQFANQNQLNLIDVREESEWQQGHWPSAVHIGKGVIERDIEKRFPDFATPLYLYCGGGYRSALAADALQKMGYNNVFSVDGGYRAWSEAGYPIDTQ
ncbi:rhodanese-like domain-containing protein [Flocculibacter collagenilyticus]|uniref:rhodanese-like domain-containing protein n=1 Tax=Flocculibacter collagenilyticus TaxID=2744479 RepID=UPI0018F7C87F|nr:rhodanese-like domain-containing protein [Flocculibacter collagenilyticus]